MAEEIRKVHADMSHEELRPILDKIKNSGAIEKSVEVSNRYLNKAFAILKELPDTKNTRYLYDIAEFIGKRNY